MRRATHLKVYADILFRVLTTQDLATEMADSWIGPAYDKTNTMDINGPMLKATEGASATHGNGNPWTSEVISLQPIRSLYLYSPNLGGFDTFGPNGERAIIKAIPVTAPPNFMVFGGHPSGNDFLDCSRQTLRSLDFQLKDLNGNLVPLHGSHWSFSLCFSILDTST